VVEILIDHIKKGKTILVHCNGGKGRTGLIVVSCLIVLGVPVDQAVQILRTARPGMLRNPAQEVFLHAFKSRLHPEGESVPNPSPTDKLLNSLPQFNFQFIRTFDVSTNSPPRHFPLSESPMSMSFMTNVTNNVTTNVVPVLPPRHSYNEDSSDGISQERCEDDTSRESSESSCTEYSEEEKKVNNGNLV